MTDKELKKRLENLDKREIVALVKELIAHTKENRLYVETKLSSPSEMASLAERYKEIIRNEFFPARGIGEARLGVAKKAIADFRKASGDMCATLDLMIYYVENGTTFTVKYGDMYERFYTSMENVFGDVVDALTKAGDMALVERFRPRLRKIVEDAEVTGWGYHEQLGDMLDELGDGK